MSADPPAPTHDPLDIDLGEELFQLVWRYRQQIDQLLAPHGLNALRALVLGLISKEQQHPKALARHLDLAPSAISHLLNEFEERGLVERNRDRVDRRRVVLQITANGRDLLEQAGEAGRRLNIAMLANLSDAEAATFKRLLAKVAGTA